MPRRNRHIRWDKGGPSARRHQKGKGGKRRREWHHSYGTHHRHFAQQPPLPDLGSGADPTAGTGIPIRGSGTNRGPAL